VHGLIFVSLRDYLAAEHGAAKEQAVMESEPFYFVSEAYPDELFVALLDRACRVTGMSRERLLHAFGVFTAEKTFARLYPALFALSPNAHTFLLGVETSIHDIVRVAMPEARPPELDVSETEKGAVSIVYRSPRRLCALLRGLVEGTARHYREKVRIEELACMDRGDDACRFEVRFGRS
jgi:predicted hydrocarbon binding protein